MFCYNLNHCWLFLLLSQATCAGYGFSYSNDNGGNLHLWNLIERCFRTRVISCSQISSAKSPCHRRKLMTYLYTWYGDLNFVLIQLLELLEAVTARYETSQLLTTPTTKSIRRYNNYLLSLYYQTICYKSQTNRIRWRYCAYWKYTFSCLQCKISSKDIQVFFLCLFFAIVLIFGDSRKHSILRLILNYEWGVQKVIHLIIFHCYCMFCYNPESPYFKL